ncbi:Methyl-accepting chemotaxis protein OS=Lysinibacillus sphaericus OX=1421 GN=LS41612_18135 PE=3 SV=1 [Lysinibacillus sphaericus]
MSVGKKLSFGFFSIILILFMSLLILFNQFSNIEKKVEAALEDRVSQVELSDSIQFEMAMQGLFIRAMFIEDTASNKDSLIKHAGLLDEHVAEIAKKADSPEMVEYAKELDTYNDAFNKAADRALALHDEGKLDEALKIVNSDAQQANRGLLEVSNKVVDYQKTQLEYYEQNLKKQ